jgi:uncharacterized protein (TIGR01615 family)
VVLFRDILLAEEDELDGVALAAKLTTAGYRVAVRQALGGGSGVAVFSNLRHSFLVVTAPDGTDFIVEPHFREQFEISQPTARYSGLLGMLPEVMVAPAARLEPLVALLCSEMSLAFEQHGLSLPPWRQSKSLLSKWLPSKARDLDISPYGSPRAASPEVQLPLTAFAAVARSAAPASTGAPSGTASGFAVSEAGSGSITPAFSGDDASPRAVLRCASARLLDHQAAHSSSSYDVGAAAVPSGAPNLVRKSLLTSSLAPSRRSCSPDAPPQRGASLGLPPPPQLTGSIATAVARAAAAPRLAAQPQPVATPALVHHAGSAMSYRVASEWQQPAIRTVKMQGQARAY